MAAFDQTAAAPILKTRYPTKKILAMSYKKDPFFGMVPKFTEFGGDQKNFVPKIGRPQGGSASFTTAQANKQGSTYKKFAVTRVEDFFTASIKGQTVKATKGDANALVEAITSEMDGAIEGCAESAAISLWHNGGGARGRILSTSTLASATITLDTIADIVNFEIGMWLGAATTDGTSGSAMSGHVQISAIDRDLGTITTAGGNWSTQISALTTTSYLFREGDFGAMMSGVPAWCPASAPAATAFFGVDRTADVTRLGGIRYSGSGGPIDEVLIEAAARATREHATPDACFMNNLDYSPLLKLLGTKAIRTSADARDDVPVSYRGVEIESNAGPIKVIPTPFVKKGTAFMLQMDTWELASIGDVPQILDLDGSKFLRESGADAYEIRVGYYAQLGCYAPGWNVNIAL